LPDRRVCREEEGVYRYERGQSEERFVSSAAETRWWRRRPAAGRRTEAGRRWRRSAAGRRTAAGRRWRRSAAGRRTEAGRRRGRRPETWWRTSVTKNLNRKTESRARAPGSVFVRPRSSRRSSPLPAARRARLLPTATW